MRTQIGLLSIAGFFGLPAQADAHAPSASTAGRTFDGKYQLVSSAKVNPMSTSSKGDMAPFRTGHRVRSPSRKVKRGIPPRQGMSFKERSGRTASWTCD